MSNDKTQYMDTDSSRPLPYATQSADMTCFQKHWKNKPQTNSVGAAALIFIAGGMNIAWSFGFTSYHFFNITTHVVISWFIGAIIGVIAGAFLNNIVKSRKYLFLTSALLMLIDGIILTAASREKSSVTAAHYLDGIAVGLIFVPTMILIGEESMSYMRGHIAASVELLCFFLGTFVQIIFAQSWSYNISLEFNVIQMQGSFNIVLAVLAVIVTLFFHIESPVYYLTLGNEQQAIESIQKLQNPATITTETYEQLYNVKEYVTNNEMISMSEGAKQSWPTLLIMVFFRTVIAMSFSHCTTLAMSISSHMANGGFTWNAMLMLYGAALFLGVLVGVFMLDSVGRKVPTITGIVICAIIAIAVAVLFGQPINLLMLKKMIAVMSLIIISQLFTGFYAVSSSAYLTEAFPMDIKPYFIAIPFAVQMLVQLIILSCGTTIDLSVYYYIVGVFSVILAVFAVFLMPETKQTTLLGAQNMFNALFWK